MLQQIVEGGKIQNLKYDDIKNLININHLNSTWFMKKSCDLLCLSKKSNKSFIYISTNWQNIRG